MFPWKALDNPNREPPEDFEAGGVLTGASPAGIAPSPTKRERDKESASLALSFPDDTAGAPTPGISLSSSTLVRRGPSDMEDRAAELGPATGAEEGVDATDAD